MYSPDLKARWLLGLFLASIFLSYVLNAQLYIAEKPCFKELQTEFFRPDLVMQALSLQGVYENQWTLIAQKLKDRSRDVPKLLQEKATRLELTGQRNPLLNPFQPAATDQLLNEILMDIFTNVLKESNVTDPPFNIRAMFGYIRSKQSAKIKACYGEEVEEPK